ncbi:hypothetical protein [Chitinophaga vietnamensis]|uniref:hypothetical protein n=1 Tax=Chitinophaga vietnamensis TaxID=2593957 RepID=UPI001178340A|nr:hypothetical protein [Chitinophaga vietnamensis]
MNEEDIRKFLGDGIAPVSARNFNERVLSRIPMKKEKKHFISFDVVLVFLLFFASVAAVCLLFFMPAMQEITRTAILLIATVVALLGVCLVLVNLVVSARYRLMADQHPA